MRYLAVLWIIMTSAVGLSSVYVADNSVHQIGLLLLMLVNTVTITCIVSLLRG